MTSLIDVIFLLLLFFMLTSTVSKFAEIELTAATSGAGAETGAKPYFLQLTTEGLRLNGDALALDALWQSGRRWLALGPLAISAALFAWFYPILSAAPLDGKMAFLEYTWLKSWQ